MPPRARVRLADDDHCVLLAPLGVTQVSALNQVAELDAGAVMTCPRRAVCHMTLTFLVPLTSQVTLVSRPAGPAGPEFWEITVTDSLAAETVTLSGRR